MKNNKVEGIILSEIINADGTINVQTSDGEKIISVNLIQSIE